MVMYSLSKQSVHIYYVLCSVRMSRQINCSLAKVTLGPLETQAFCLAGGVVLLSLNVNAFKGHMCSSPHHSPHHSLLSSPTASPYPAPEGTEFAVPKSKRGLVGCYVQNQWPQEICRCCGSQRGQPEVVREGHLTEMLAKGGAGMAGDKGRVVLEEESQKQGLAEEKPGLMGAGGDKAVSGGPSWC